MVDQLSREELFVLVWERPAEEVTRELGISGVALAKRCKKLQVPKPPLQIPNAIPDLYTAC